MYVCMYECMYVCICFRLSSETKSASTVELVW